VNVAFSQADLLSLTSHQVLRVGRLLFPLFALALDLPESYFDDKVLSSPFSLIGSNSF
jgi:isopenicillin N synthase-like dioxygenase